VVWLLQAQAVLEAEVAAARGDKRRLEGELEGTKSELEAAEKVRWIESD